MKPHDDTVLTANPDVLTDWMIRRLRATGKLKVRAGNKRFWILAKSWHGSHPWGYAISENGIRPAAKAFAGEFSKYRMLSDSELANWLHYLDLANLPPLPTAAELRMVVPARQRVLLKEAQSVQAAWRARGKRG